MVKPFELDELLSRIKNLLTQVQPNASTVTGAKVSGSSEGVHQFEFGNAKINFKTYQVKVKSYLGRNFWKMSGRCPAG